MPQGVIESYNAGLGQGYLKPDAGEVRVTFVKAVVSGNLPIQVGKAASYELVEGSAEPEARNVVLL